MSGLVGEWTSGRVGEWLNALELLTETCALRSGGGQSSSAKQLWSYVFGKVVSGIREGMGGWIVSG